MIGKVLAHLSVKIQRVEMVSLLGFGVQNFLVKIVVKLEVILKSLSILKNLK